MAASVTRVARDAQALCARRSDHRNDPVGMSVKSQVHWTEGDSPDEEIHCVGSDRRDDCLVDDHHDRLGHGSCEMNDNCQCDRHLWKSGVCICHLCDDHDCMNRVKGVDDGPLQANESGNFVGRITLV